MFWLTYSHPTICVLGLGVYSVGDALNYAFLASRLHSVSLQTKLLRHSGIVTSGPSLEEVVCAFNVKMEIDLLSNPDEIAASKLMKKLADIYFTRVIVGPLYLVNSNYRANVTKYYDFKHRYVFD